MSHVPTWGWDPAKPGMRGAFDVARMEGLPMIPLMVNTMADAVAGFVYEADQLKAMDAGGMTDVLTGQDLIEDEIAWWQEVRGNGIVRALGWNTPKASDIPEKLDHYAWLGEEVRMTDPARHYAAMAHVRTYGGFDAMKALMSPKYAAALQDTVDDYTEGVQAITRGVRDFGVMRHTSQTMRAAGEADFDAIAREVASGIYDPALRQALPPAAALAPYLLKEPLERPQAHGPTH